MTTGTICKLVSDRGFGFIRTDDGDRDVFFHVRDVLNARFDTLAYGQRVEFEETQEERGRRALSVRVER